MTLAGNNENTVVQQNGEQMASNPISDSVLLGNGTAGIADEEIRLTPEQLIEKATGALSDGRRHLVCHDYQEAVTCLDLACELFCKRYDEMAYECAEPYFYYGKSLVELERANQQIVNVRDKENDGVGEDVNDEDSEDESESESGEENEDGKEDINEQDVVSPDPQAAKENASEIAGIATDQQKDEHDKVTAAHATPIAIDNTPVAAQQTLPTINQEPDEKSTKLVEKVNGCETSDVDQDPMIAGSSKTQENESSAEKEQDEKSNTTAEAWEMLDLARIIYEKHLTTPLANETDDTDTMDARTKHDTLRLAEIRMALGEVCTLDEKYQEAASEFMAAQEILRGVCSPDDRRLAETYFQIGSVSEFDGRYDLAAENIKSAAGVLESRKRHLTQQLSGGEKSDDKLTEIRAEIDELTELLTDIDQRLADLFDSQRNSVTVRQDLNEFTGKAVESPEKAVENKNGTVNGNSIETTDVSHLVRKPIKRITTDAETDCAVVEPKKAKVDTVVSNVISTANTLDEDNSIENGSTALHRDQAGMDKADQPEIC